MLCEKLESYGIGHSEVTRPPHMGIVLFRSGLIVFQKRLKTKLETYWDIYNIVLLVNGGVRHLLR